MDRVYCHHLLIIVVLIQACVSGCGGDAGVSGKAPPGGASLQERDIDSALVAARVNGTPISLDEVRAALEAADGGISVEAATDLLVTEQLLVEEAGRRGYGTRPEVERERRRALARALLSSRVGVIDSIEDLDQDRLRNYYEMNIGRFVHDVMRRVAHLVALTGSDGMSEEEARELASRAADLAAGARSKAEFMELLRPLKKEKGNKVKLEALSAFEKKTRRLVAPFVKAAFEVPGVGKVSPPVRTKFGWHVIYVDAELPAIDISFEEAKDLLAEEVLPRERKLRADALLERLEKEQKIFVHEDVLSEWSRVP